MMLQAGLTTKTKFLCTCARNESACPYCLGLVGALPLPNRTSMEYALAAAKALGLPIATRADFLRTLDPDAPRGYRVGTTAVGEDGPFGARLWLEENKCGGAELCVEGNISAGALGKLLADAGIESQEITSAEKTTDWHPYPDLPGVLLGGGE